MVVELLAVAAAVLEHGAHRGAAVAELADDVQRAFHLALADRRVGRRGRSRSRLGAPPWLPRKLLVALRCSPCRELRPTFRARPYKNYSFFSGYESFLERAILGSMQYLSQRLAVEPARARGRGAAPRPCRRRAARAAARRDRAADRGEGRAGDDDRSDRQGGRRLLGHLLRALPRQGRVLRRGLRPGGGGAARRGGRRAARRAARASGCGRAWRRCWRRSTLSRRGRGSASSRRRRAGRGCAARYDEALDAAAAELADPLGQAIAGGLAWLLRERLELGGGGSVQDLLPRMTEVVLAPQPAQWLSGARAAAAASSPPGKDRLPPGRHGLPRELRRREPARAAAQRRRRGGRRARLQRDHDRRDHRGGEDLPPHLLRVLRGQGGLLPRRLRDDRRPRARRDAGGRGPAGALARAGASRGSPRCSTSSPATSPSPAST